MQNIPVVITVYDRLKHLKNCVESIKKNELAKDTELFVVSDAAYRDEHRQIIKEVRSYVDTIAGFKKVHLIAHEKNKGVKDSFIEAKRIVFSSFDALIVMEDDITVSPYYLKYMNLCMKKYKNFENIYSVTGYQHPYKIYNRYPYDVFFMHASHAWGFGIWKEKEERLMNDCYLKFEEFVIENKNKIEEFKKSNYEAYRILKRDINGELVAGDARREFYQFCSNKVSIIPLKSLTKSNGHDGSGINCGYDYTLQNQEIEKEDKDYKFPNKVYIDPQIFKQRKWYFGPINKKIKILKQYFYYYVFLLFQKTRN